MIRRVLRPLWASILLIALVTGAVAGCAGEQEGEDGQQQNGENGGENGGGENGDDDDEGGMYGAPAPGSLTVADFDGHRLVLVR